MLANRYAGQDVSGWWLSEKLDGCRAFWDHTTRTLRTRSWRAIDAPDFFLANMPQAVLDGELWLGRGTFELAKVLVQFPRRSANLWERMKFMVFDAPTTDAVSVEDRMAKAKELAASAGLGWVEQRKCIGREDAENTMRAVVDAGGEGLMLRRPAHFYEFGRSSAWLKVKPVGVD